MAPIADDINKIVSALARVFREEGRRDLADLLAGGKLEFEETSYDNWNGGTYGYTLRLEVPAAAYAKIGVSLEATEKELLERLRPLTRNYPDHHIEAVVIDPSFDELDAESREPQQSPLPPCWEEGQFHLFLSHLADYKAETSAIARALSVYGISAFVAHEDIEPTKEWEDEIRSALATCDALACLLTPGFNASRWTDQEVGFAIGRGLLVVPIRLGLDPYGFMGRYQGYQGVGKPTLDLARDVALILAKHPLTQARMAEALVWAFEQSNSFAEAKSKGRYLELIQSWTPELAHRVRQALQTNPQVAGAFGVPAMVENLLARQELGNQKVTR